VLKCLNQSRCRFGVDSGGPKEPYQTLCVQVKCDQYWPTRGTDNYGVMHVTLVDVVELATYTIRTFLVTRVCFVPTVCS